MMRKLRLDPRLFLMVLMVAAVTAVVFVPAGSASASTTRNALTFSGALKGTLKIRATTTCDSGPHGTNLSGFASKLSPSKATNWSISLTYPGNGTYKSFVFGGKASFVLQSGLNGWGATKGSFTIRGKTGTVNLTLGAHEGSAKGTVYVKGGWSCR